MLTWLWDKLEKEFKVIKGAPISFALVCGIGAIICYSLLRMEFGNVLALRRETIQAYQEKVGELSALPKQRAAVFQVMVYTNDPRSDKLVPQDTNAPALAYPYGEQGPGVTFFWDIKSHNWK